MARLTKEYLEIYGGNNLTPEEMHDALIGAINHFYKVKADIPKIIETLTCLNEFVKDNFDLVEKDIF